jgi:hypothetical protein
MAPSPFPQIRAAVLVELGGGGSGGRAGLIGRAGGGGSHLTKTTFSNNFAPILLDKEKGKFT